MLRAGARLGPYEILGPLGAGGMGEVYRALDARLGREVAVKVLPEAVSRDPERISRFEKEARALAALSHPNVLAIHDVGRTGEAAWAVTELLEGETLRDRLLRGRPGWREAAQVAAAVADGLAAAHARHIVHRDLKPENVFLTSDGRLKVFDFGLAKVVESVLPDATTLTSPASTADGQLVGTLAYMSPEQARGHAVDERTDVFSLGGVLHEMLSGRRAFDRATQADTLSAILHEEPPSLEAVRPAVPAALASIVSRCLEKDPARRFHSAHDLALALRSLSADAPPGARLLLPGARPLPARRFLLVAAVLAGAVGLALLLRRPERPSPAALGSWEAQQLTSAPGWEAEPAVSPDGRFVAFASDAAGTSDVWVVDARGGEPLQLTGRPGDGGATAPDRHPAWLPDGRTILFASARSGRTGIWRVPALGGSPSLVVEDADDPAVSRDGTLLAFTRPGPTGYPRVWVAPLAAPATARRLTSDEDGLWEHADPAFSPDGRTICFSDFRDLWTVGVDGGRPRPLTTAKAFDSDPVFSSDGSTVTFASRRDRVGAIWSVPAEGGAPSRVTTGTGPESSPSFSADGRTIAWCTDRRNTDVLVVDRLRGAVHRLGGELREETPAVAPDGSSVVFASDRIGPSDLWLQPLRDGRPDGVLRRLTSLSEGGPATPDFSPDGRLVAFFRALRGERDLWVLPLSGGTPRPLVANPGRDFHPAFSPDGARLAFVSSRSGPEDVWVTDVADGATSGEPWRLTDGRAAASFPSWSADSRRVAFLRGDVLWIVDASPGSAAVETPIRGLLSNAVFDLDGESVLAVATRDGRDSLLRLRLADGRAEELRPPLELGAAGTPGFVSASRDRRTLALHATRIQGDVWVARMPGGPS